MQADMRIRAVIFDMDGVLIDSEMIYLDDLLAFARTMNPQVQKEEIIGTVGKTSQDTWEIMEAAIQSGRSWQELRQRYRGWSNVQDRIDYQKIFRPEAVSVLTELKKRGYRLAVASSTHRQLVLHVLFSNGVLDYFDTVVTGDMFARSKPDPEIYHYTAAALGVAESQCFVLEDSTVGITAAHRAGMEVAALIDDRFGFDRSLADHEVESVSGILTLLEGRNISEMKENELRTDMILIKGGRVIDPKSGFDGAADLILHEGRICRILKDKEQWQQAGIYENMMDQVIDASGLIVAPGLVDVHVHFRDPGLTYKEDIHTGAAAAAKGGFTTVVCMANTMPKVDTVETLRYVLEEGKKTGIHVLSCGAVSKNFGGGELTDMEALKEAGAVGFTDDGIPLRDEAFVKRAMEEAARLELPISLHEENPAYIRQNGINHGAVSDKLGIYGSPALAEDSMVARDCMIALATGVAVDIQHISSGNAVDMVRLAKGLGANVWAEVTPHHFTLTEDAVLEHGSLAKMNPPLRTEGDRQRLIQGLQDGTIDMIATDHAPHSAEEKAKSLTEAPSGIIGLETSLALGITELVEKGYLTMVQLMAKMSWNPARLYHLDCGRLEEGAPADLVLFDEKERWTVKEFASKASNSPFIGAELTGKVKYTICAGKVVYRD